MLTDKTDITTTEETRKTSQNRNLEREFSYETVREKLLVKANNFYVLS